MIGPETPNSDDIGFALAKAVSTYCEMWRNPNLPHFVVHHHTYRSWHNRPEAAVAGCYAAYTINGTLLYVGKASHRRTMGQRLYAHFEVSKWPWVPSVAYVQFVEVSQPFEAPSLEEFLIADLQPRYNSVGIRRVPAV